MVARDAKGEVDAEVDAVGVGEFDLGVIAAGAEDADVGDDALSRADDGDGLLAGELAGLIEVFELGEL